MGWVKGEKRYRDLKHNDPVRFNGYPGRVYKPGWFEMEREDIYVAVILDGTNRVQRLHFESLQVEEPDPVSEPVKPQFRETEYFVETSTGALFKRQYQDFKWHFIALGTIRQSISSTTAHPDGFKRLYREA